MHLLVCLFVLRVCTVTDFSGEDKGSGAKFCTVVHRPILGFWGAKYPQMRDSLPRTPMNHRAKFDAASFVLAGEIRNRTNKKTNKLKTNSNGYTHFAYRHVWIANTSVFG